MTEKSKFTRRSLSTLLGSAALAPASALAQPAGGSPEKEEAVAALRSNAQAISKVKVPREVEPAFRFQA